MPRRAATPTEATGSCSRTPSAAYATGRSESVRRWMRWFAERELVEHYPALAVLGALLFSSSERLGDMERWAAARPSTPPHSARALRTAQSRGAAHPIGCCLTAARSKGGAP